MHYYATLGYTPSVLLGLRDLAPTSPRVTVFHGNLNRSQVAALRKARILLEELRLDYGLVETARPWDIRECLQVLFERYARDGQPRDLMVNASGGTEVMNAAATILGLIAGCRVQYVDRHTWESHDLDFGVLRKALGLEGTRRNALDAVLSSGGRAPVSDLSERLGVTAGAVSQTLKVLAEQGILRVEPMEQGRGKVARLHPSLWVLEVLGAALKARIGRR